MKNFRLKVLVAALFSVAPIAAAADLPTLPIYDRAPWLVMPDEPMYQPPEHLSYPSDLPPAPIVGEAPIMPDGYTPFITPAPTVLAEFPHFNIYDVTGYSGVALGVLPDDVYGGWTSRTITSDASSTDRLFFESQGWTVAGTTVGGLVVTDAATASTILSALTGTGGVIINYDVAYTVDGIYVRDYSAPGGWVPGGTNGNLQYMLEQYIAGVDLATIQPSSSSWYLKLDTSSDYYSSWIASYTTHLDLYGAYETALTDHTAALDDYNNWYWSNYAIVSMVDAANAAAVAAAQGAYTAALDQWEIDRDKAVLTTLESVPDLRSLAGGNAVAPDAVAIGSGALATGNGSMALGLGAWSDGLNSQAIGTGAIALANDALAIGTSAFATGTGSTAIGAGSWADGTNAQAFGTGAQALGDGAIALGDRALSAGGISIGTGATGLADGAIAIGDGALSWSSISVAIGNGAQAVSSVAIGTGAQALGLNTTAIGDYAAATGDLSVAVGAYATATGTNSVALGAGTIASRDNTVAVGGRTISQVATPVEAMDAANKEYVDAAILSAVFGSVDSGAVGDRVTALEAELPRVREYAARGTAVALASHVGKASGSAIGLRAGAAWKF